MGKHRTVTLARMSVAHVDSDELLDHVFASLAAGSGGFLVTANLDILRRHALDPAARAVYDAADLRIADGMPLVWASAIAGDPLPERIAGASLVPRFFERAARERRSVYLLGGDPGVAEEVRAKLGRELPTLDVVGIASPFVSCPPTAEELAPIVAEVRAARPSLVLVAMGSPKQEYVCRAIRDAVPGAWCVGIGAGLSFYVGRVPRAPLVFQRLGLEWAHRLAQEPRRLARRYLLEDLPFAVTLGLGALGTRLRSRQSTPR